MSDIQVKICGLNRPEDVVACAQAGARYVGFNFFPKSPRYVDLATAHDLAVCVPVGLAKVGLTVNATDAELEQLVEAVPLDILQFHGSESPERVAELRDKFGLPVMKALGVAGPEDLPALSEFALVADQLLVDAKPPKDAELPGGNGLPFDWRLLAGRRWPVPWMLAGGLKAENVSEAIRLTGASQLDVSSGVESAPGVKSAEMINSFVSATRFTTT